MSTQTLVPSSDTTVHLVLNDFGYVGRAYIAEAKADEWTTVRDIANGEYSNPVQVIAFNVTEGWARDVTQHIAQLVLELCRQEDDFSQPAREFVERILNIFTIPDELKAIDSRRWPEQLRASRIFICVVGPVPPQSPKAGHTGRGCHRFPGGSPAFWGGFRDGTERAAVIASAGSFFIETSRSLLAFRSSVLAATKKNKRRTPTGELAAQTMQMPLSYFYLGRSGVIYLGRHMREDPPWANMTTSLSGSKSATTRS